MTIKLKELKAYYATAQRKVKKSGLIVILSEAKDLIMRFFGPSGLRMTV